MRACTGCRRWAALEESFEAIEQGEIAALRDEMAALRARVDAGVVAAGRPALAGARAPETKAFVERYLRKGTLAGVELKAFEGTSGGGGGYALFEDLQLADYGNRIPSLTFEVEADDGDITLGMIAHALAPGAVEGGDGTLLGGYAVAESNVRDALAVVGDVVPLSLVDDGENLRLVRPSGAAVALTADALGAGAGSPSDGQAWAIGTAPTGDWAGRAGELALRTGGGWRFIAPSLGMTVWNVAMDRPARWDGTHWRDGELRAAKLLIDGIQVVGAQQVAITAPSSGSVQDAEARTTIGRIIDCLRVHGLIAS